MKCFHCHHELETRFRYCPNCGYSSKKTKNRNHVLMILAGSGMSICLCGLLLLGYLLFHQEPSYYFRKNHLEEKVATMQLTNNLCELQEGTVMQPGGTVSSVVSDNTYKCDHLDTKELAYQLIEEDSKLQKRKCPLKIQELEKTFTVKYGITAINLCEMDVEFAEELGKVFEKIYEEFPTTRGYLTNLTLKNESMSRSGVIASFLPIFAFANISSSQYQLVIKTQMFLSSSYFLNPTRLKVATEDASHAGHFPPNATIYSPVAHEMGHYLSFIALLKSHGITSILLIDSENYSVLSQIGVESKSGEYAQGIVEEAYQNYQKDFQSKLSIDEWRATISSYAVARDNSGRYIYDETIAEAFHDTYLNGNKAKDASKYIVAVLKERLS